MAGKYADEYNEALDMAARNTTPYRPRRCAAVCCQGLHPSFRPHLATSLVTPIVQRPIPALASTPKAAVLPGLGERR